MPDRLAEVDEGSGYATEFLPDFREDLGPRASPVAEFDIKFIHRHGHDVVVPFRAAGAATNAFHFGDGQQQPDGYVTEFVGLWERSAGR